MNSKLDETKQKFSIEGVGAAIEMGLATYSDLVIKKLNSSKEEIR